MSDRRENYLRHELAHTLKLAALHAKQLPAALAGAKQLDTRGYPTKREADSGSAPAGTVSDPTASAAVAGMPGCRPADPHDRLVERIADAVNDLTRAARRFADLSDMATANASPLNTCADCEMKVSGLRQNKLRKAPDRPDRRVCEKCRSTLRRKMLRLPH